MPDEKNLKNGNNNTDELESSLEDLLTLAFNKKKDKENNKKSGLDVKFDAGSYGNIGEEKSIQSKKSDSQTPADGTKGYKTSVKKVVREQEREYGEDFIPVSHEDSINEELSIEQMVANAMAVKKGGRARAVERVATEEDAISREELEEILANDEMYEQLIDDDEPQKKKWYQNKALMVGLSALAVVLMLVGIVLVIFLDYYDKIKDDTDYKSNPGTQDAISENDTLDANDYEEWLKKQLEGIADNAMSNENVTNILIIAEDLRDTTGDSRGNTDVMILASINKEAETLTLTSFMRDIYCDIPGYYASRLNSAYAKGGPQVLMDTLQSNFGVVVDKYVLINFYSFIDVVEAIGGIEADVTQAHIDAMVAPMAEQNSIMGNPKGTDYLTEPGHYVLNGNQALAYARIRHGVGDDFGRTSRQREVIFTAINKAKEELSFSEIKKLVDKILDNEMIKTNLDEGEVASLLINCFDYMDYEQQQLQIPADGTWSNATIRGNDVLSLNFAKNAQIIQETIYGETNIDLGDNSGEYVNTYTTKATTYQEPDDDYDYSSNQIQYDPEPVYTTTTPQQTYTPPVVTASPSATAQTTTPTVTTQPPATTTSQATTTQQSASSQSTAATTTAPPVATTPEPQTEETPSDTGEASEQGE